jgi:5-methylcytosine-specific restriction endonuclease McrA
MKEEILRLQSEGKTADEIRKILGCHKRTVLYHLDGENEKTKKKIISKIYRFTSLDERRRIKLKNKTEDFQRTRLGGLGLGKRRIRFRWQDVVDKFGWTTNCYLTGDPIDLRESTSYHFDHIVPYAKGGDSTLENLGIATRNANQAKSDMSVEEFLELCQKVLIKQGYEVKPPSPKDLSL